MPHPSLALVRLRLDEFKESDRLCVLLLPCEVERRIPLGVCLREEYEQRLAHRGLAALPLAL